MLYHFELQMAGVILLGAMLACGIWLHLKRRRERQAAEEEDSLLDDDAPDTARDAP